MAQTLEFDLEGNNEHRGNIYQERPTSSEAKNLIRFEINNSHIQNSSWFDQIFHLQRKTHPQNRKERKCR